MFILILPLVMSGPDPPHFGPVQTALHSLWATWHQMSATLFFR